MNKKGMFLIMSTILIILAIIVAVSVIWVMVVPLVRDKLSLEIGCINADVSIGSSSGYTCYDKKNKIIGVQVMKGTGRVNVSDIQILLSRSGESKSFIVPIDLNYNSKRVFYIPSERAGEEVSIAPIIKVGSMKKTCDAVLKVELPYCNFSSVANLNLVTPMSLISSDFRISGEENSGGFITGPFGYDVLVWDGASNIGNSSNKDWHSIGVKINPTKTYRVSVWEKEVGSASGMSYFGVSGLNDLNGDAVDNSYFWTGNLPNPNKWYFLVGYIHGSGDNSMINYGGVYDGVSGKKVYLTTDFKSATGSSNEIHRLYLSYDGVAVGGRYFWNPTFSEVDSSSLPIEIP